MQSYGVNVFADNKGQRILDSSLAKSTINDQNDYEQAEHSFSESKTFNVLLAECDTATYKPKKIAKIVKPKIGSNDFACETPASKMNDKPTKDISFSEYSKSAVVNPITFRRNSSSIDKFQSSATFFDKLKSFQQMKKTKLENLRNEMHEKEMNELMKTRIVVSTKKREELFEDFLNRSHIMSVEKEKKMADLRSLTRKSDKSLEEKFEIPYEHKSSQQRKKPQKEINKAIKSLFDWQAGKEEKIIRLRQEAITLEKKNCYFKPKLIKPQKKKQNYPKIEVDFEKLEKSRNHRQPENEHIQYLKSKPVRSRNEANLKFENSNTIIQSRLIYKSCSAPFYSKNLLKGTTLLLSSCILNENSKFKGYSNPKVLNEKPNLTINNNNKLVSKG